MATSDKQFDVVVIGDCNPDIILRGPEVAPEFGQREKLVPDAVFVIGGSGSITACACARVGLRTRFVGATGDDTFGRFMLDSLRTWDVDTALCPVLHGSSTGFSVILSRGEDRAILTHAGTIDSLELGSVPVEQLLEARHVHISSYFLQPRLASQLPSLVGLLRAQGVTVSVDPNWDPTGTWDGGLRSLLSQINIFLPNAAEARAMSGAHDTKGAASQLCREVPLVVVKDGDKGGIAAEGAVPPTFFSHPAFPVQCADTTGAGDAFNAGFLRAWLDGLAVGDCLAYACATGALSTRAIGATGALPTLPEVRAMIHGPRDA
jgi:sugar/nucleoside kinase (ribokinase family)